jgi:3-oxoacyl-[acyl-carrier-protein] synthase II
MSGNPRDVVITGIGIVSSLGVGRKAHAALLASEEAPQPVVDSSTFAPYAVHPLPEIDWSEQIPKRGDQRQMDTWQRLGVFAAGLALDDAGLKEDAEACATMDMIVAAGGGARDDAVDTLILDASANHNDREVMLNEKLMSELRPTLFLAQLSNLMAGNISIVHKVTGSSRTFMGEEAAGISALETAFARIRAGQSTHALVGGAHVAERPDMQFNFESTGSLAQGDWRPVSARAGQPGGGVVLGSAGAFLVIESRERAEARGATILAVIDKVEGDRGRRDDHGLENRLERMANGESVDLVLSGASGRVDPTTREHAFLAGRYPDAARRTFANLTGHALEAQFPLGAALAAMALSADETVAPFDAATEDAMDKPPRRALVTTVGYLRGEGVALLSAPGERP